ncbi:WAT1-related protein At1g25270-like [Actinidia eriantha]|uniref:WAT1-related protein At1g25270-like n=1 Tax=Actinidia eriantha TaxID=165200 RepID=UPI00258AFAC2|nr:WAT1-related protein At1g25270-like [Actinidia eriantha]
MGRVANTIHGLKPVMMMVVVQAALAGITIFYKIAGNIGMSLRVLIAYRFLIGAAFMVPLALVIERKSRPKLTWLVAGQAFLCGLLGGSMAQNLYAESLVLTSATFAAAMTNLIPAITFILAISFGLEKLGWGTMAGKAKVVGTLLCISGAMLLTFYKGLEVKLWSTNVDLLHKSQHHGGHVAASHPPDGNHVLGALLVVCCCLSSAMGLIFQAKMVRNYPCPYSGTALVICMGAIQATVFALCMERDWSQWKLGWNIRLLTVTYSGIVASGLVYTFMTCCVQMRGPLFVSVFSPLMLVLVAIAGSLVLEEKLYMGSVLGAVAIVSGLYVVLWGKGKELKRIAQLMPSKRFKESERIEVIVTSSSETNNNIDNGDIVSVIPNGISTLCDDAREEEKEEEDRAEGKGGRSELYANI